MRPTLLALLASAFAAGCATTEEGPRGPVGLRMPLTYHPNVGRGTLPDNEAPRIIGETGIAPFADARQGLSHAAIVGNNDGTAVVATTPVANVITEAFREEFQRVYGSPVAADPNQAGRTVRGQLLRFWVEAGHTYRAEVRVRISVVDNATSTVTYDRLVTGEDKTWGGSQNPENDAKVFLGAIRRAIYAVLEDPTFPPALGAPAVAVVEPPAGNAAPTPPPPEEAMPPSPPPQPAEPPPPAPLPPPAQPAVLVPAAPAGALTGRASLSGVGHARRILLYNDGMVDWTNCDVRLPNNLHYRMRKLQAGRSDGIMWFRFAEDGVVQDVPVDSVAVICAEGSSSFPFSL